MQNRQFTNREMQYREILAETCITVNQWQNHVKQLRNCPQTFAEITTGTVPPASWPFASTRTSGQNTSFLVVSNPFSASNLSKHRNPRNRLQVGGPRCYSWWYGYTATTVESTLARCTRSSVQKTRSHALTEDVSQSIDALHGAQFPTFPSEPPKSRRVGSCIPAAGVPSL